MTGDNRGPIVSDRPSRWWSRGGQDVDLGGNPLGGGVFRDSTVEAGSAKKAVPLRTRLADASAGPRGNAFNALAVLAIAAIIAFHALPRLALFIDDPGLLAEILAPLPQGRLLTSAALGLIGLHLGVWIVALVFRLQALNIARKQASAGAVTALVALIIETGAWVMLGAARDLSAGQRVDTLMVLGAEAGLLVLLMLLGAVFKRRAA